MEAVLRQLQINAVLLAVSLGQVRPGAFTVWHQTYAFAGDTKRIAAQTLVLGNN